MEIKEDPLKHVRADKVKVQCDERKIDPRARARGGTRRGPQAMQRNSASFVFACRGGWMRVGVGSSGAVILCLGGNWGRTPPHTICT